MFILVRSYGSYYKSNAYMWNKIKINRAQTERNALQNAAQSDKNRR